MYEHHTVCLCFSFSVCVCFAHIYTHTTCPISTHTHPTQPLVPPTYKTPSYRTISSVMEATSKTNRPCAMAQLLCACTQPHRPHSCTKGGGCHHCVAASGQWTRDGAERCGFKCVYIYVLVCVYALVVASVCTFMCRFSTCMLI